MNEMVELTNEQRAVVETTKSKVVVIATAAAGKTRCITERVRWLLKQGIDPKKIVAITFTNAAAEEISDRLGNPPNLFVGTIHSLANYYLRSGGIDTSKVLNEEKFDELFKIIKEHPECIHEVEHLIVDESQDSNALQFEFLLDMIKPKNYMLCGDHRQAIYRFAGAYPDYLINLVNDNPEVTTYDLTQNYRNAPNILEYAKALIKPLGSEYKDKSIPMRNSTEGRVVNVDYSASGIATTIQRYVDQKKCDYRDWFVLTRTNAELDEIYEVLKSCKIPCDTFKKANLDNKGLKGKMEENTVKVLTIHTAKGLEAKNVIVIGARFRDTEERCISYVAATRAKDLLVWTIKRAKRAYRPKSYGPNTTSWE